MSENRKKVLLHVCCGPCSTVSIKRLKLDYNVAVLFYNPCIAPAEEYNKRIEAVRIVADHYGTPFIEGENDHAKFLELTKRLESLPEGAQRCLICFRQRLNAAAVFAKKHNFDFFTTSLTLSPHKDSDTIFRVGNAVGAMHDIKFLEADFKKLRGFDESVKISNELGIYRQNYCGCEFSFRK